MSDLNKATSHSYWMPVLVLAFLLLFPYFGLRGSMAQNRKSSGTDSRKLEVGKAIERELSGGAAHSYEIGLKTGQLFKLIVEQRGIDVVVKLINSIGVTALEVDSPNGANGAEPLTFIATTSGKYRVEVRSLEKDAAAGRYAIRLAERRAATDKDRALYEADKLMQQASALRDKGAYNAAVPLAEKALLALREKVLGSEPIAIAEALNQLTILYIEEGEFAKAEPVAQRALAIREKRLGAADPDVAEAANMLGMVYKENGDYDKAEPLFKQAFSIFQTRFGNEHPNLAPSLITSANCSASAAIMSAQSDSFNALWRFGKKPLAKTARL